MGRKVGRNEECPCGSGRKYKHCCLRKGIHDPYARGRPPEPPAPPASTAPTLPSAPARPTTPTRRSLRGAAFTPAAAVAVSRGADLGGMEFHPWIVAQLRDRTGVGAGGRPAAWTISRVRARDTEALVGILARLGVQVDPATFAATAESYWSAWDLAEDWSPIEGADHEVLGLIACELWRRWLPDVPSLEMLDERMQDGYDALDRGDARGACEIWLDVWDLLLDTFPDARSADELDEQLVTGLNRVTNWVGDVAIELSNLSRRHRDLALRARDVYRRVAERLSDGRLRRDFADLLFTTGEADEGVAVLEALVRDEPDDPWAYAHLSDWLGWRGNGAGDVARAIAVLEQALARPVKDAAGSGLADRLVDLRARQARG